MLVAIQHLIQLHPMAAVVAEAKIKERLLIVAMALAVVVKETQAVLARLVELMVTLAAMDMVVHHILAAVVAVLVRLVRLEQAQEMVVLELRHLSRAHL